MLLFLLIAIELPIVLDPLPPDINVRLSNVDSILQDAVGYLWFGTQDGLFRYDGYQLKAFHNDPADPTTLSANWITTMAEDAQGNLWVGTFGGGLSRMNPERTGFQRLIPVLPDGREASTVRCLMLDSRNVLWGGLENGGLLQFQDLDYRILPASKEPGSLQPGRVQAIFEDHSGDLWIATAAGGLNRLAPGSDQFENVFLYVSEEPNAELLRIWSAVVDGRGSFWLGTSAGLYHFDPRERRLVAGPTVDHLGRAVNSKAITDLVRTDQGLIWAGTNGNGLFCFNPRDQTLIGFRNETGRDKTLPHDDVNVVFQDRTNLLWIGALTGGIFKIDTGGTPFNRWQPTSDTQKIPPIEFTKVVFEDQRGNLWVGGNKGIVQYHADTNEVAHHTKDPDNDNTLSHNSVRAAVAGEGNDFWLATWGGGLNRWDAANQQFVRYLAGESEKVPKSNYIETLHRDDMGNLWLGTIQGLEVRDGQDGKFRQIPIDFSEPDVQMVRLRIIRELNQGKLYIGSNYGLATLNRFNQTVRYYRQSSYQPDSLANNVVRDILRAKDGKIWIATAGGLNQFHEESETFTLYDEKDGLSSHVVYSLMEDDDNRLWIGTHHGLSRFDPLTGVFTNFFEEDGILNNEFNGGATLRASDGRFLFGGTKGLIWFFPRDVRDHATAAGVVISEMKIFDTPANIHGLQDLHGVVQLEPNQNFLSFEFTGLDFRNPHRTQYNYRMDGVDDDWRHPGTRRYVDYPNLKPGDYTLRVKGANSDGVWNKTETVLPIRIETPIMQETWVQTLALIIFLAPLVAWLHGVLRHKNVLEDRVRARTRSLECANKQLERSHHELEATQTELMNAAHQAGMTEVVNGVLHNIGNVLNSVGVNAETLREQLSQTRSGGITRLVTLLETHQDDLANFLTKDPQGQKMVPYLKRLGKILDQEQGKNMERLAGLIGGVDMLRDTVRMQQGYAKNVGRKETLHLDAVADDMISLNQPALSRHAVAVTKAYQPAPMVTVQRFKLAHILTNLIRNAIDAIGEQNPEERRMTISITDEGDEVLLRVSDTGVGISQENLAEVTKYGFTTKETGKGFGLHSCAGSMTEMGGELRIDSKGVGKGATFTLAFPKKETK